jgi:hypothetical protein
MTIRSVRIYYYPEDKADERRLSQTHWGFAEWFVSRLKPIREQLRGPEAKGVNIVNFMLHENPAHCWRRDQWARRLNSFEYSCEFDFSSLLDRPPIQNIERLMVMTAEIASKAPWPQVLAVGRALAAPLTEAERESLLPYLQWPRTVGKAGKLLAQRKNGG